MGVAWALRGGVAWEARAVKLWLMETPAVSVPHPGQQPPAASEK